MHSRLIAVAAGLALILTACGERTAGGSRTANDDFRRRAGQAIAAWEAAGKPKAWTSGFVPLEELTVLPRDPGFTDNTRLAYRIGAYRLSGRLPEQTPRQGTIRWPDGRTLSLPLISARDAYAALDRGTMSRTVPDRASPGTTPPGGVAGASAVPCPECDLTVTGARLGVVSLHTSRGVAQVPAWSFTVPKLKSPVVRVAVRPETAGALPTPTPVSGGTPVYALDAVPGDPLRLRVTVLTPSGECGARSVHGRVYESAHAIVVGSAVTGRTGDCPGFGTARTLDVTLTGPVGGRVVLDTTGRPIRLGEHRPIPA
ncbi:hypothetical protein GCM10023196_070560 [Actinoallomurus vinaceus]|uniref:Lipoprotein n=1 Tax=Actinoallomurus vinaceus TaxID=1080074 RepID=A0ABP8ULD0_9ACTN